MLTQKGVLMTALIPPELITAQQLAERFQTTRRTVNRWVRAGRIPAIRFGPKIVRFDWVNVCAHLSNHILKEAR
jgi:excisionase family DNA binding protein